MCLWFLQTREGMIFFLLADVSQISPNPNIVFNYSLHKINEKKGEWISNYLTPRVPIIMFCERTDKSFLLISESP